jgi:hypothetical protein
MLWNDSQLELEQRINDDEDKQRIVEDNELLLKQIDQLRQDLVSTWTTVCCDSCVHIAYVLYFVPMKGNSSVMGLIYIDFNQLRTCRRMNSSFQILECVSGLLKLMISRSAAI